MLGMTAVASSRRRSIPRSSSSSAAMRSPTRRIASIFAWRSAGVFHPPDLLGDRVALRFEAFHLLDQLAPPLIQLQHSVDRGWVHLAPLHGLAHDFRLFADQIDI